MPRASPWAGSSLNEVVLTIDPHPLLALGAFETRLPKALGEIEPRATLLARLALEASAPVERSEAIRTDVRDLLRHGGYKPTGRGKPASEYLVKAASDGPLRSINLAVDACNVVSLHSGLPISVVDADRLGPPLRVGIVEGDQRYPFNATGQEIRLEGLICLFDAEGPCANAVKDSQRTKTGDDTRRTLSLIWGPKAHADHVLAAMRWYRQLLEEAGAETTPLEQPGEEPAS